LRRALDEYTITGIRTNVSLFRRILGEAEFLTSNIHTNWLDELLARPHPPAEAPRAGTGVAENQTLRPVGGRDQKWTRCLNGSAMAAGSSWIACHEIRNTAGRR